jgi:sulfate/thiosulfate transport system ATP-binding protein
VFENIAFGLRVRPRDERPTGSEISAVVKDLLQLVELDALGARYPSELSGGQQQRVALARALAVQPRVLLLDEPFGALDARVRQQLRQWLRTLHDEVKVTTVLVTHDSEEACEVADRVAVMHEARIAQIGTAAELARSSANPFLESFLAESTRKSGGSKKINFH